MAGYKDFLLILGAIILMMPAASAVFVDIEIDGITEHGSYDFKTVRQNGSISVSTVIENIGSIGCVYRLRGVFNKSGEVDQVYSGGVGLWPGESEKLSFRYIPLNYTGPVQSTVYVSYCGQDQIIKEFEFNSTKSLISNKTVSSKTVTANSSSARITIGAPNGTLIPITYPAGWKVSSVEFSKGQAAVEYQPTLFQEQQKLEYLVLNQAGELIGRTTVELDVKPTLIDKLEKNKWKFLFAVSVIFNIGFLAVKRPTKKIKALKHRFKI